MEAVDERLWRERKEKSWERLWEDLEIGYLDEDIVDILVEFFLRPRSFTTSSCSGRIVLMDSEYPWDKDETMIVFKKHEPVSVEEVSDIAGKPVAHRLWLSVQGPIIHIEALDIEEAFVVLEAARRAGFKHSGILASTRKGILVELRTGIRVNIPLREPNAWLISEENLPRIVELANRALRQAKERLDRLRAELRRIRPSEPWRPPSIPPPARHYLRQLGIHVESTTGKP